jgi:hypothetical protein
VIERTIEVAGHSGPAELAVAEAGKWEKFTAVARNCWKTVGKNTRTKL